ncbi:class I SAM-dependent methyltransferase [Kiloniella laminariae]|uniref:Class I SAM-dependent methyltransferase n=1 Tax=Kiloniella laminariae TaxID=454162 RepID=A0ABT4LIT5_9PROT|nr:class I SAM-dependent methyltransferase [Kiloniella laminariae]MCZ4281017.1 class I SAM-dependent methyltransferase [Kiloniella laminariae]
MDNRKFYTEANRESWDEAAPKHRAANQEQLLQDVQQRDFNPLADYLQESLALVGVKNKKIIQLCCNNGKDVLAVQKMGARSSVGVDAAPAFIEQGRELVEAAGLQDVMQLIASDVYDLPKELAGQFDIVLTTVGVMSWMPDIKDFFRVVHSLLKPGGHYVVEEMHPVLLMYEPDENGTSRPLYSYFRTEPWKETDGLDYFNHENYDAKPCYSFQHKMDDILMAGINNGMSLKHIKEIDRDISNFCQDLQHQKAVPPLGFTMVMQKS